MTRLSRFLLLVLGLALASASSANAQARKIEYQFKLETNGLENELSAVSDLAQNRTGPRTLAGLRAAVKADMQKMKALLRAEGYYGHEMTSLFNRAADPLRITVRVNVAERFTLGEVMIDWQGGAPDARVQARAMEALDLQSGAPARSEEILAAELRVAVLLPQIGHPLSNIVERDVVVDHARQTVDVTYRFDAGPAVTFGDVVFQGLESVSDRWLRRRIPWDVGQTYDDQLANQYRRSVNRTGLFSSVSSDVAPDGTVTLDVTEAEHRTISLGAGWATTEGFGADAAWQHRNIFGAGEALRFDLLMSEIEQSLSGSLRKPDYLSLDQTLLVDASFRRQDTIAFNARTVTASVGLQRQITERLNVSAGIEVNRIDEQGEPRDRKFTLFALPTVINWDRSDDLLDPRNGFRLTGRFTPAYGLEGSNSFNFFKNELTATAYYGIDGDDDIVLAGRLRLGSITGASLDTIPANRRFFAGGGGSIRGFGFQRVGPLDDFGDPIGGRSLTETSVEVRWQLTETIGVVPFVEAGNIYEETRPRFSGFRWGAGVGFRYYTSFGPVRFDIATPLDRRPGEDSFQIYISIGQAF